MLMIISMKSCKTHLNCTGTEGGKKKQSIVSMATGDLAKTPYLCVNVGVCVLVFECVSVYEYNTNGFDICIIQFFLLHYILTCLYCLAREKTASPASREIWVSRATG